MVVLSSVVGSLHRATGLTLKVYRPLLDASSSFSPITIDRMIDSWDHEINAFGGFGNANFAFSCKDEDIDMWLYNGLGRHVVGYNRALDVAYEGFINTIKVNFGSVTASIGPLLDVGNRVSVMYTPILDYQDPPTRGTSTETTIVNDTESQGKYGIIEKVYSGGELIDDGTTNEAEEIRDLYLMENKWPYTDENVSIGSASAPKVIVECAGYSEWLDAYVYNNIATISTTVSDKLKAVITADPNGLFPTGFGHINTNMQLTPANDEENRFAMSIIKELVQLGDGTDTRWLFGVYEDREPYFASMPLSTTYKHVIRHGLSTIETVMSQRIDPWDVRPGQWVYMPDFPRMGSLSVEPLSDYTIDAMRLDPRFLFIESVKYTSPQTLSLTGSRVGKLAQRLAQLGIGGRS